VLQPYNLVERDFERTLRPVADGWDLAVLPYYALAKGFLTGKYRPGGEAVESPRAESARAYLDRGGRAVLAALDEVAAAHDTTMAAVALAWLITRPRVVAPIASARTTHQLEQIRSAATLALTPDEVRWLSAASEQPERRLWASRPGGRPKSDRESDVARVNPDFGAGRPAKQ
jgi:aryl-alcohol dehydrogenase (NADP+)